MIIRVIMSRMYNWPVGGGGGGGGGRGGGGGEAGLA